jgi:hypothetical protein
VQEEGRCPRFGNRYVTLRIGYDYCNQNSGIRLLLRMQPYVLYCLGVGVYLQSRQLADALGELVRTSMQDRNSRS